LRDFCDDEVGELANAAHLGPAAQSQDLIVMSLSGFSSFRLFCATAWLSVAALVAFALLTPLAASGQSAALALPAAAAADNSGAEVPTDGGHAATDGAAAQARSSQPLGAAQNRNTAQSKCLTTKAIGMVKQVTKSANDIFGRVPCLPPKAGVNPVGTLPHIAVKLGAGQPVVIVAFGSS